MHKKRICLLNTGERLPTRFDRSTSGTKMVGLSFKTNSFLSRSVGVLKPAGLSVDAISFSTHTGDLNRKCKGGLVGLGGHSKYESSPDRISGPLLKVDGLNPLMYKRHNPTAWDPSKAGFVKK